MENIIEKIRLHEQDRMFDVLPLVLKYANDKLRTILSNSGYGNTILEYNADTDEPASSDPSENFNKALENTKWMVDGSEKPKPKPIKSCLCYFFAARFKGLPKEATFKQFAEKLNELADKDLINFGTMGVKCYRVYPDYSPFATYVIWAGIFSKIESQPVVTMKEIFGRLFTPEGDRPELQIAGNYTGVFQ